MKSFISVNKVYLIILFVLFLMFLGVKFFCLDFFLNIDEFISDFFQNNIVSNGLTSFFKVVTNFGDVLFFVAVILLFLIFVRKKIYSVYLSICLFIAYLFSVIFKNIFMRERPIFNLIQKPSDYSFPSGHTMCSVAFYGFIIYLIINNIENKYLKCFLSLLCVLCIIIVGISRIYLNVHYFTDVFCGAILGLICLLMFINYVKIREDNMRSK